MALKWKQTNVNKQMTTEKMLIKWRQNKAISKVRLFFKLNSIKSSINLFIYIKRQLIDMNLIQVKNNVFHLRTINIAALRRCITIVVNKEIITTKLVDVVNKNNRPIRGEPGKVWNEFLIFLSLPKLCRIIN